MIFDEEARKNGWAISETKPGYATKTMQYKNATIIVNRPILSPAEQKKREEEVSEALAYALRDYVRRKELEAYEAKAKGELELKE